MSWVTTAWQACTGALTGDPGRASGAPLPADAEADVVQHALRMVVREWSDEQLSWAWRTSDHQVRSTTGPAAVEAVVRRQMLLEEVERRDPAGFALWMDDHALTGDDTGLQHATDDDAA
ncbi:MAG: hypothetical protein Q7T56_02260 [Nocardioidaceae bacterium]|nr:hypothetical protein [Nocardioidaceae bacterium]